MLHSPGFFLKKPTCLVFIHSTLKIFSDPAVMADKPICVITCCCCCFNLYLHVHGQIYRRYKSGRLEILLSIDFMGFKRPKYLMMTVRFRSLRALGIYGMDH